MLCMLVAAISSVGQPNPPPRPLECSRQESDDHTPESRLFSQTVEGWSVENRDGTTCRAAKSDDGNLARFILLDQATGPRVVLQLVNAILQSGERHSLTMDFGRRPIKVEAEAKLDAFSGVQVIEFGQFGAVQSMLQAREASRLSVSGDFETIEIDLTGFDAAFSLLSECRKTLVTD